MLFKAGILFAWMAASYLLLVFVADTWWAATLAAISLGLAVSGIGFNVQHDAGHGAFSKHRVVNRTMAWALDMVGGSSYFWHYKHNIAHHTYPNVHGADDDLVVGRMGRLCPHDPWRPSHRLQHLYMWFLYGLLTVRWTMIDDYHSLIDPGIGKTHVPRPRGWDLLRFWLGKAVFVSLALVIPFWFHGVGAVALFFLVTEFTAGVMLASVFQLAHCVGKADFPQPVNGQIQREWAAHQLDTTVNFAPDSALVTWYTGGLNHQIEHHLYPHVCHLHYRALARIVERTAGEHGVPYRVHKRATSALASHYRWLKQMGQREQGAPVAASVGPPR